jgi:chlorite dismutase
VKRVFRRGFVRKVLSASPGASYGLATMLYGTLLPAPDIGRRKEAVARMREADAAGHAIDTDRMDPAQVLDVMIESFGGEEEPLADMIRDLIEP